MLKDANVKVLYTGSSVRMIISRGRSERSVAEPRQTCASK